MNVQDILTRSVLRRDHMETAEKELGRPLDWKNDKDAFFGTAVAIRDNIARNAWLESLRDTTLCMDIDPYLEFVLAQGFTIAGAFPIQARDGRDETMYVFFSEEGLMLTCDTYCPEGYECPSRNSAHLYFSTDDWPTGIQCSISPVSLSQPEWTINSGTPRPEFEASVCSLDAREALGYHLRRVKELKLRRQMPKQRAHQVHRMLAMGQEYLDKVPFDTQQKHLAALYSSRFPRLPPNVQEFINGTL